MKPCLKPKLSITTFTMGTRQLVVHDAFEMIVCLAGSYFSLFTPMQIVMSSPLAGAEMTTFLAPAARCLDAFSLSVNPPVHRVEFQQVRECLGIGDVVDTDKFDVALSGHGSRAEHVATDSSEPVDPHPNCHVSPLT